MNFDLALSFQLLTQTPHTLKQMLGGLSPEWTREGGSEDDWSPYDIMGHLIHGERTDWIGRAEIILGQGEERKLVPFDRLAQFEESRGKSLAELLSEFADLRRRNLETVAGWHLTPEQLALTGIHPVFGEVTLEQLLATWVCHDLNHIRQIVRFMARKYDAAVGPWKQYLTILN